MGENTLKVNPPVLQAYLTHSVQIKVVQYWSSVKRANTFTHSGNDENERFLSSFGVIR